MKKGSVIEIVLIVLVTVFFNILVFVVPRFITVGEETVLQIKMSTERDLPPGLYRLIPLERLEPAEEEPVEIKGELRKIEETLTRAVG